MNEDYDKMHIRPAEQDDFGEIAILHINGIDTGFLSSLGISFLRNLYTGINKDTESCIIVVERNSKVIGFIAGTLNTNGLYKKVILRNWCNLIGPITRFLFNWKTLVKIVETLLYGLRTVKQEKVCKDAELLSIAVAETERGNGTGKKMICELERFFRAHKCISYKVITNSDNYGSNKFYLSCNFVLNTQFLHHGIKMNEYVKILS